jgi:hypothetical protein
MIMATQSVEFSAPPNQTLTVRLFSAGSDTIVATAGTVTAATNRAGLYTAAFTDVPAGRYRLIATNAAGTPLATWWTDLTLTTATFPSYEMPLSAITADVYAALPADHTVAGSYGARFILAVNSNRQLQLTGSNHAAADVHEFQTDVITADAIAADAVTEIQGTMPDRLGYMLSILAGAISDAGTAAETYTITLGASTFTVDYSGLDAAGNRTGATLTKT